MEIQKINKVESFRHRGFTKFHKVYTKQPKSLCTSASSCCTCVYNTSIIIVFVGDPKGLQFEQKKCTNHSPFCILWDTCCMTVYRSHRLTEKRVPVYTIIIITISGVLYYSLSIMYRHTFFCFIKVLRR